MGPHLSDFTQKRYFTQKRFITQKAFNLQSAKQDLVDGRSVTESNILKQITLKPGSNFFSPSCIHQTIQETSHNNRRSCSLEQVLHTLEASFGMLHWCQVSCQVFPKNQEFKMPIGAKVHLLLLPIPLIANFCKLLSSPSWLYFLPSVRRLQGMAILVLYGVFICPTLLCSSNKGLWGSSWELL